MMLKNTPRTDFSGCSIDTGDVDPKIFPADDDEIEGIAEGWDPINTFCSYFGRQQPYHKQSFC